MKLNLKLFIVLFISFFSGLTNATISFTCPVPAYVNNPTNQFRNASGYYYINLPGVGNLVFLTTSGTQFTSPPLQVKSWQYAFVRKGGISAGCNYDNSIQIVFFTPYGNSLPFKGSTKNQYVWRPDGGGSYCAQSIETCIITNGET